MQTIDGFKDRYGAELRRRRYFADSCASVAESFGFEPISVPIVERAEAYDQEIVGLSPWPEWNPKGCFFFSIDNFTDSYGQATSTTNAVLIPEGTLSVTRWLGAQLNGHHQQKLPIRIYYDLNCFRNELTSTISSTKGRSFSQFGLEILGAKSVAADIEPMVVAHEILVNLGIKQANVVFRISSNELFLSMATATCLTHVQRVELKEQLDTIAECKAGKRSDRLEAAIKNAWLILNSAPKRSHDTAWAHLIQRPAGKVSETDRNILGCYGTACLDRIQAVSNSLSNAGVMCEVDYCVVRSHEYYTGITFEIDLLGKICRYVEIGGGGRYDRLLGNFTPPDGPKSVPCVGFAFGVERLISALVDENLMNGVEVRPELNFDLTSESSVKTHPRTLGSATSIFDEATNYIATIDELREKRENSRISVDLT